MDEESKRRKFRLPSLKTGLNSVTLQPRGTFKLRNRKEL
jgi:hypothetical protein